MVSDKMKNALKNLENSIKEIPLLPSESKLLRDENKRLKKLFSEREEARIKKREGKKRGGMVKKFSSGGAATRGLGKVVK